MENQIGQRILFGRQNRQMTQEEFAARLGVTPQAVSKWERGQGLPDTALLTDICMILNISANELLAVEIGKITENDDLLMKKEIQSALIAEPLTVEFSGDWVPVVAEGLKTNFVNEKRAELAAETGMLLPIIRLRDSKSLTGLSYRISVYDKVVKCEEVKELSADSYKQLITETVELCRKHYASVLNKQLVMTLIETLKANFPGVADNLIPEKISYLLFKDILAGIVAKKGTLRNLIQITEWIEEEILLKENHNVDSIVEQVTKKM